MSGRVFLRPPAPRDRDEFLARVHASRTLHRPWAYPPADETAFAEYLRRSRTTTDASLVCLREGGAIVGAMNISNIVRSPSFRSAALGYYGFVPYDGQRYMAEGLRLVLRRAFGEVRLHRLEANVQPGNDRSISLVRGAGFQLEGYSPRFLKVGGRWRDHERWAITVDDLRVPRRRP